MLKFLIDSMFIEFGRQQFHHQHPQWKQTSSLSFLLLDKRISTAVQVFNLTFMYINDTITIQNRDKRISTAVQDFNLTFRYINDTITIQNRDKRISTAVQDFNLTFRYINDTITITIQIYQ